MQATEAMFMIILTLATGGAIFGIYYLRNRENMAMIERGINPREGVKQRARTFTSLKFGLLLAGSGLGLLIAYLLDQLVLPKEMVRLSDGSHYTQDNPAIYFALIGLFGGLGLVLSYTMENKGLKDKI
jgi:O-antigen/teichoic acid export membrane protein